MKREDDTFDEELLDYIKAVKHATGVILVLFNDNELIESHCHLPPGSALFSAAVLREMAEVLEVNNSREKGWN